MAVEHLNPAEAPDRSRILALIDTLRQEVEDGQTISFVCISVHPAREFTISSAGNASMLELAGMLGRAWLDATEALKK